MLFPIMQHPNMFIHLLLQKLNWPIHPLGGPDFDAYEPIDHPWTREETKPEQEPVDAGAIMDVENDPDWDIQQELPQEDDEPDWANPQQLNRFLPIEQANDEIENAVEQANDEIENAAVYVPVTRRALRSQPVPYSFDLIVPSTRLSIVVMGIEMAATALRKRNNGSWRVKFDGRTGRSIDLFLNDTEFPQVKFL